MNQVEVKVLIDVNDSKQLEALNALFATLAGEQIPMTKDKPKVEKPKVEKPKVEKPKVETGKEEQETKKDSEKEIAAKNTKIDIEEVRSLLSEKIEKNRPVIKAKLTELGAPNVSTLEEEKYPEFMEFLKSLK